MLLKSWCSRSAINNPILVFLDGNDNILPPITNKNIFFVKIMSFMVPTDAFANVVEIKMFQGCHKQHFCPNCLNWCVSGWRLYFLAPKYKQEPLVINIMSFWCREIHLPMSLQSRCSRDAINNHLPKLLKLLCSWMVITFFAPNHQQEPLVMFGAKWYICRIYQNHSRPGVP